MALTQDVASALQYLHSPATSAEDRKAADDWLTGFQRSTSAWEVQIPGYCHI